jgi:disulfide bond formation protein DsbB
MISSAELLVILVLFVFYSLIIFGLIIALRRLKVPAKIAIVLGFLIFSVISGLGVVWRWPDDISVMVNFPASLTGDWIYQVSIQYLGDPASSQAHYTIPWILRIPQVYVLASVLFWGLAGLLVQLIRDGWVRVSGRHH